MALHAPHRRLVLGAMVAGLALGTASPAAAIGAGTVSEILERTPAVTVTVCCELPGPLETKAFNNDHDHDAAASFGQTRAAHRKVYRQEKKSRR